MGMINCHGHSAGLISLSEGSVFATKIKFGTESFEVVVDTGSSDTWVIKTGFQCVGAQNGTAEPEDYCGFGPTYNTTKTFSQVPDENFNITYGDNEFLTGIIGHEKVTLAGITVKQTIAIVNLAAWYGDGTTSGLVGLAYPSLCVFYSAILFFHN
jgi:Eukaryotic aspartyl protease